MKNIFETTVHNFEIPRLPGELAGVKIIHLGDLHNLRYGENNRELARAIDKQQPDFIFVSGDMCDRKHRSGDTFLELVALLGQKYPIYVSIGNHEQAVEKKDADYYGRYQKQLKELGAVVLDNSRVRLTNQGRDFYLYGFTHLKKKRSATAVQKALSDCPKDAPVFVLCHNPNWFDVLEDWGACAVFSGHIHGGLIRLPLIGGLLAPGFRLFPKYDSGAFDSESASMYVTRGFGDSSLHIRLNNPRELAALTLVKKPKKQTQKPSKLKSVIRRICTVILLLLTIVNFIPLVRGIIHIGVLAPMILFPFLILLLHKPSLLTKRLKKQWMRSLRRFLVSVGCAGIAVFAVLSVLMSAAAYKPAKPDSTVIVLGCQVRGTTPSLMLANRLNAALDYLNENPDSNVVVSGGQGTGEDISEAQAMQTFLVEHGIASERIFLEERSTSTSDNIAFSAAVIRASSLSTDVVIATDEFHQYRAALFARKNGLNPSPASSHTPWYLFECYWIREMCGIAKAMIFGT